MNAWRKLSRMHATAGHCLGSFVRYPSRIFLKGFWLNLRQGVQAFFWSLSTLSQ